MKFKSIALTLLFFYLATSSLFADEKADEIEKAQDEYFEEVKKEFPELKCYKTKNFAINYTFQLNQFTKKLPNTLEGFLVLMRKTLSIASSEKLYDGRLEIYLWESREDFLKFAGKFDGFNASSAGGYFTITRNGWPRINMPLENNSQSQAAQDTRALIVLLHEGTHAVMAKYRSDVRLPTWLNEGLADFFAFSIIEQYYKNLIPHLVEKRRHSSYLKSSIKSNRERAFKDFFHQEGTSGGADRGAYALGWATVAFMAKYYPRQLVALMKDIKDTEYFKTSSLDPSKKYTMEEMQEIQNKYKDYQSKKEEILEETFKKHFKKDVVEFGEIFYKALIDNPKLLNSL